MNNLQGQHKQWLTTMYPDQPKELPAIAMVEEAGELVHVLLKKQQEHVWGREPRYAHRDWTVDLVDAVGDCAISCCSWCNATERVFLEILQAAESVESSMLIDLQPLELATMLLQAGVGVFRRSEDPTRYIAILRTVAASLDLDFERAVLTTWETVRLRTRKAEPRPTVVCLCGSTKFWREFQKQNTEETLKGNIVLSIGATPGTDEDSFGHLGFEAYSILKEKLDQLHFRKIEMADEVLVLNIDNYMGYNTRREVEYARKLGKKVRYLETYKDNYA